MTQDVAASPPVVATEHSAGSPLRILGWRRGEPMTAGELGTVQQLADRLLPLDIAEVLHAAAPIPIDGRMIRRTLCVGVRHKTIMVLDEVAQRVKSFLLPAGCRLSYYDEVSVYRGFGESDILWRPHEADGEGIKVV